ncbi:MAG: CBASS cGAMP-activated phospholipase [Syntrophus sp. (in: bacteria)]
MTTDNSHIQNTGADRFQILSLDGGGVKGLFSAALLAAIEEDLKINVVDHFDLIAGTSTGGIIAIGIGLGMKPREIVEFYLQEGPKIFPSWFGVKWFQHWVYRKFSPEPLITALRSCFKEKQFGDSKKRLVIPSYNLGEDDVYIFRTPHAERLKRDYKVPAWKVALATSAAPTFFPCTREVDSIRLIDGGVWANNPTMVAIIEAFGTLNVPLSSLWALSIGTSDAVSQRCKRLNSGGIISWGLENAAIDVIMRGQSIGTNNQATFLLGRDRVERLNPKVAADEFSLDGIHKADDLIGKASHHSRIFIPMFEQKFAKHQAAPYVPMYT